MARSLTFNVHAPLDLAQAVLPGMVDRNRGHVVNLGSVAGSYPYPGGNVYGATKAFVSQFSLNLRADLHGTAIRVTSIEPGRSASQAKPRPSAKMRIRNIIETMK